MRGLMYHPGVQRALLEKLAHWGSLPQGDLLEFLSPVDRLRYRPEALADLEHMGLVTVKPGGDEPVVRITPAGQDWLARERSEARA